MPSHAPLRLIARVRSQSASSVDSDGPPRADPRVVDQEIEPAPSRDQTAQRRACPVVGLRHIEVLADRLETLAASSPPPSDRADSSLDVGQDDLVRGRGERPRDPQSDPLGRTRDQGDRPIGWSRHAFDPSPSSSTSRLTTAITGDLDHPARLDRHRCHDVHFGIDRQSSC